MSLLPSGAIETGGYDINNSLRLRRSNNAYLSRTPASAGNQKTWTYSAWVKRGLLGSIQDIWHANGPSTTENDYFAFDSDTLQFRIKNSNVVVCELITTQVFRDPSAWYHIIVAWDSTQATSSNRVKIYVNGVQITSFSTATYPSQNTNTSSYNNNVLHTIGTQWYNSTLSNYYDGYITEINFIDGQALTPSSFGETDAVTGVWKAKKYTGTYGTNGFYLKFANTLSSGFSSHYGSFNGSSQYLSISSCNATNFNTGDYTVEAWVYQNSRADLQFIVGGSSTCFQCYIEANGTLNLGKAGTASIGASTGSVPLSIWTHVAYVRSGTTVTYYINGIASGTATDSNSYNLSSTTVNIATSNNNIGSYDINGNLSNVRVVKGSAVYTSNFTPPTANLTAVTNTSILTLQNSTIIDNSTNAWSITNTGSVAMTSATIGTYLIIANDSSSNNNHWIPNNISVTSGTTYDAMTDSPTNTSATVANYATWNPLVTSTAAPLTFSNANLDIAFGSSLVGWAQSSIGVSSGKWYAEITVTAASSSDRIIGIVTSSTNNQPGYTADSYGYYGNGQKINNNSLSNYGASYTTNDIIGIALDLDAGTITFYKNNTSQGQAFSGLSGTYFISVSDSGNAATCSYNANFGQRPFAYTPPTGFKALNTYNLPDSTIKKGNSYMDATAYTGTNGSPTTQVISSNFQPDFLWFKKRSASYDHALIDTNRGITKQLYSNLTNAEGTDSDVLTAIGASSFTVGNSNYSNYGTLVAWTWKANGGTTSSNTAGSITSTVQANTTAGFSIVTYTNSAGRNAHTVGHGLGVAPKMFTIKTRSATADWPVYHASLGATKALYLNQTLTAQTSSAFFNNTAPTSTVITLGSGLSDAGVTIVAYCWAEIEGFSRFGSYVGNGAASGPFIYTGFRPKFVMIKNVDTIVVPDFGSWKIIDTSRDTFNGGNPKSLYANRSYQEGLRGNGSSDAYVEQCDLLSNGFKLGDVTSGSYDVETNQSGVTYIYAAFAENPFKNALAR